MYKPVLYLFVLLFFVMTSFGQASSINENPYYKEAFSQNSNFQVAVFRLSGDLHITLEQEVIRAPEFTYVQIPTLFKKNVTRNFSILSGVKFDFYRTNDWEAQVPVFGVIGAQYDFNSNAFIQGSYNYKLNNAPFTNGFGSDLKSHLKLSTGIKF